MDIGSFISMIVNEALYFPCATEFQDPFEGYLPVSHMKAMKSIAEEATNSVLQKLNVLNTNIALKKYEDIHAYATEQVRKKTGVSCWHMNDHESEAMWKLYANKGIAVESTINQLQDSFKREDHENKIFTYAVRYEDFETAEIEKGHQHYFFAIKRKSFEHERELRATVSLPIDGQGVYIKCNLDKLITKIHISPLSPKHVRDDLEKLCENLARPLKKPFSRSSLYDSPEILKINPP